MRLLDYLLASNDKRSDAVLILSKSKLKIIQRQVGRKNQRTVHEVVPFNGGKNVPRK